MGLRVAGLGVKTCVERSGWARVRVTALAPADLFPIYLASYLPTYLPGHAGKVGCICPRRLRRWSFEVVLSLSKDSCN